MGEIFNSTLQFDIDFDKFRKNYWFHFWLDEVLKLHTFFESYGLAYVFQAGYQANRILTTEERDEIYRHMTEEFPWAADCITRFEYLELGAPRDLMPLFKSAAQMSKEELEALKAKARGGEYDNTQPIPPLLEVGAKCDMTVGSLIAALGEYDPDKKITLCVDGEARPFWELAAVTPVVEMEANQTHPTLHIRKIEVKKLPLSAIAPSLRIGIIP